jgi:4-amino-4-deoxy-L-arabinose transferase-like glycosyltransferase
MMNNLTIGFSFSKCYNLPMPDVYKKETRVIQIGRSTVRLHAEVPSDSHIEVRVSGGEVQNLSLEGSNRFEEQIAAPDSNGSLVDQVKHVKLESLLFVLAILIYLVTRFVGLEKYPIYFFTDEAIQTVSAEEFVDRGCKGSDGQLFPTYFLNSYQYNLGTSVYWQVIPYLIFGKSIYVTRAASMLATVLAAVWLGLIFKHAFGSTRAWMAVMLLSIAPAWFLHSRTAFETSLASSLFVGFLYFYLRYRQGDTKKIYLAVILAALTFYAYSPIRMVIGVTAILLFFSDLKYHFQHRKQVGLAFALTLVCAIPMLRFQLVHPDETLQHLRVLNSYWIQNIPLSEKLLNFGKEYFAGLNPIYWFFANDHDLARHQMDGYGHMLWAMLPFALLGLGLVFIRFRQSAYRVVFFTLLAAPSGAALAQLGITRALVMIIPLTLLAAIGLNWLLEKAVNHWKKLSRTFDLIIFSCLAGFNLFLCVQALTVGSLWYQDYGLAGMQYGARQLVTAINAYLDVHPDAKILVSPSWANGTDTTMRFFYDGDPPFEMGSIEGYFNEHRPITDTLFVMIPEEFRLVQESGKFQNIHVEETIPYPNGQPGFYFVRLDYVEDIDEILAKEKAARQVLQKEALLVQGMKTEVSFSYLDMGSIDKIFDGDDLTLIRTFEANPLRINMAWDSPRPIKGVFVRVGGTATTLTVRAYDDHGALLVEDVSKWDSDPNPRTIPVNFSKILDVNRLEVEVLSTYDSEPAHVHLWEITLQ